MNDCEKLPVVYVEWVDSMGGGRWQDVEGIRECASIDNMLIKTVGWLVADEDDYVVIAHSNREGSASAGAGHDAMAPLQIPRVAVMAMYIIEWPGGPHA